METPECSRCVDILKPPVKRRLPRHKDVQFTKIRRIDHGNVGNGQFEEVYRWKLEENIQTDSIVMTMIGWDLFLRCRTVHGQRFQEYLKLDSSWDPSHLRCLSIGRDLIIIRRIS
ncbi:unnamed protein product [Bursaphelenchus xylophilus]|uniref:(pine wood nematode) hypothetical protein n=1 Tax=Bursaphelenchus xylophilus TaxID=6326 RepID=A0A1I7RNT1_BURXY|nr:unnamed protein product [Bursaphelenchus xylophilus]CAG9124268.1 unnamed protein product [Bursaphelenchus xylophilus]